MYLQVDSVVGPILIAGLKSGCICILYAKDCLIGLPCPAHDEPIAMLATSRIKHLFRKSPAIIIVSYGGSGLFHVWIVEIRMDAKKSLLIHNITILNLHIHPLHMKLIDSKLCVTTSTNQIYVYDLPLDGNDTFGLYNLLPLTHNKMDDHTNVITSLSSCTSLDLFATSSRDGWIKVWDCQCQLISNINLGSSISCVCFNDTTHDLLVGFQNQLHVIPAHRYLSQSLHQSHKVTDTMVENPLTFQPNLKFW